MDCGLMTYPGLHQDWVKKLQFPGHSQFFVTHPRSTGLTAEAFPSGMTSVKITPVGKNSPLRIIWAAPSHWHKWPKGSNWEELQVCDRHRSCDSRAKHWYPPHRVGKPELLAAVKLSTLAGTSGLWSRLCQRQEESPLYVPLTENTTRFPFLEIFCVFRLTGTWTIKLSKMP